MSAIPQAAQQLIDAKQNALHQQIGYTIAGKALDVAAQQGEAAVELIEQAAQLGKALGAGDQFDRLA